MADPFPVRVALFSSSRIALPLVLSLQASGRLGGVVLTGTGTAEELFFCEELNKREIPLSQFSVEAIHDLLDQMQRWEVSLILSFSFPGLLPSKILNFPSFGAYNLHPSALPEYRGATPIFWQIRHGIENSELCIHHATSEADAGNVVVRCPLTIHPLDTFISLALTIGNMAPMVVEGLFEQIFMAGAVPAGNEQAGEVSTAPVPAQQDFLVEWEAMTAVDIKNCARACNGFVGGATFYWRRVPLALLQATPVDAPSYGTKSGTVVMVAEPEGLVVTTRKGAVRLDVIATAEGVFSGLAFAERFGMEAGSQLESFNSSARERGGNG